MREVIMKVHSSNGEFGTSLTIISDLVHRHRKIIALSENIENLFSIIALLQLLWNTLIICCSGFMIILVREIDCFDNCSDNEFDIFDNLLIFFAGS